MALPAVLLKAKGMVKKGAAAYNLAKQAKNTDGEEAISSLFNKFKLPLMIGLPIIITFVIVLVSMIIIIVYPRIMVEGFFGGGNNQAYASTNADDLFFSQCGNDWSGEPYDAGGSSICAAGCGLCSITHAIDILTGNNFTPKEISDQLRNHYSSVGIYAPGGSVVAKLVEFATEKYGLTSTHYNNINDAIDDMKTGNKVIVCSDNGSGKHFINSDGSMYSANHVIMCYKTDGENCWVKDSGRGGNNVKYTKEQLGKINFVGFYVVGK